MILIILAAGLIGSCKSRESQKSNISAEIGQDKVEACYFHFTRRCATCNAVEGVTKNAVAEFYGSKVNFSSYNLDGQTGKDIGKQLNVSGQALIIVSGNARIDITNEGFLNARKNPEKLRQVIKEKIDALL